MWKYAYPCEIADFYRHFIEKNKTPVLKIESFVVV